MTGASDRDVVGAGRGRWRRILTRRSQALDSFAVAGRNPQLRLILIARLATVTGRWASAIALAVYAYDAGGATYVGVLAVVRIVPSALAGGLAAALLDRVRTDRLLLVAGLARVVAIGAAGFAALSGTHTAAVFALVAVESLLSTMARPLQTAALPFLARVPRELTASNLALTTIESAGMLIGPIVGGVLLAVWNAGGVLLVTAATYLVSALLIARIPAWQRTLSTPSGAGRRPTVGTIEGIRAIHADKRLRLLVGLYCVENVVTGSLNVLVVIAALDLLDLGNSGVGELNAAIGIGGLLGAVAGAALVGRRRMASGFGLGLVLCGVPLVVIGVAPSVVPTILLLAILGIGVTIAGNVVSRLGPGEGFGEIALLRDVPRTATVTASSAARLYALEREQFLETVSQSPPSADAAENVIDMRLGSLRAGLATL